MIINIPLQIDDEMMNSAVLQDYQRKIEQNLTKMVENRLLQACGPWCKSKVEGINAIVDGIIADVIDNYKEEIIERAATKLAERLVRVKAAQKLKESIE